MLVLLRLELGLGDHALVGGDRDGLPGLGVAALALGRVLGFDGQKFLDLDLLAGLDRLFDRRDGRTDGAIGLALVRPVLPWTASIRSCRVKTSCFSLMSSSCRTMPGCWFFVSALSTAHTRPILRR